MCQPYVQKWCTAFKTSFNRPLPSYPKPLFFFLKKKYLSARPDNDFDLLLMKMKLICIGKVLRLALSMHVLCAAALMSLISRMVFVFNFEQLLKKTRENRVKCGKTG